MRALYTSLKYLAITLWTIFVVGPFLWALSTSFKDFNSVTSGAKYIPWLQFQPSTEGWAVLLADPAKAASISLSPFSTA